MILNRKNFIQLFTFTAGSGIVASLSSCASSPSQPEQTNTVLKRMTDDIIPISLAERNARIEKAQRLLTENKLAALVLDAGTSMKYFTGISWGQSERTMLVIIPAKGEPVYICPAFEENRLRELIKVGKKVYAWDEDES